MAEGGSGSQARQDLRERTKQLALRVIKMCAALLDEVDQLLSISVASIRTTKQRLQS
ncbi:hypothetical protein KOR34_38230 [Posidoniimonas corsicana]|uniref:Uncharacterized protein n=1 Tax=Posidoniimonas corsicana TaxID=1938618 RepID=A0A5C5V825_9BACT|nr:hypothetical protein KOR34_38230 [Posidoniimonas corsicana]